MANRLNTSVLFRMPRDCTAPTHVVSIGCTVPLRLAAFPTQALNSLSMVSKAKKARNAAIRAAMAPKGRTPFSAPQLFVNVSRPRGPRAAAAKNGPRISAPIATTRTQKGLQGNPSSRSPETRKEYVGDIAGSVTFANTSYSCNPGLANLFPWLSQLANSYDQYEVLSMAFVFEPEQATTATGAVILSFDYDAADPAPVDKVSALETKDSVRSAPWTPSRLILSGADLRKRCADALFVRAGTVPSTDIKTYDLGNLNVSTVGQASTATVGELWIEYSIRLLVPQRQTPPGQLLVASSVSKTAPFTGTQSVTGNSIVATATGTIMTFQVAGYYLITHVLTGTGLTAIAAPTGSTGTTVSTLYSAQIPTAGTSGAATFQVRVLAGSTLTFDDATGNTTVTATSTTIAPWFTA